MSEVRGGLEGNPFTWQRRRDGSIAIEWRGQAAGTLTGTAARKLALQLDTADMPAQQRLLAKATGNFKRGNER